MINKYVDSNDMDIALALDVDGASYVIRRGIQKGKNTYLEVMQQKDGKDLDITKSTILET